MKPVFWVYVGIFLASLRLSAQCDPALQYESGSNNTIVSCATYILSDPPVCLLPLTWIQCVKKNGDPAIRMNQGDVILWISDMTDPNSASGDNYKLRLQKFTREKIKNNCDKSPDDNEHPFGNDFSNDNANEYVKASTVLPGATTGRCWQHQIVLNGATGDQQFDPHVIIGDGLRGLKNEQQYKFTNLQLIPTKKNRAGGQKKPKSP